MFTLPPMPSTMRTMWHWSLGMASRMRTSPPAVSKSGGYGIHLERTIDVQEVEVQDIQRIWGANGAASVIFTAQMRGEGGGIVEAVGTAPIDRAIPCDQRGAVKVAQKCVHFEGFG